MKKLFSVLSLVVFCSVIFTGCDSNSIVGTWKTEEVLIDGGIHYTETVTFNEDNTGVITMKSADSAGSTSRPLTWTKSEENKYLVTIEGDEFDDDSTNHNNFIIEIEGGKFTVLQGMSHKLYDEKNVVYVKQ